MERLKVVAHYKDGKIIKGFTHDFFPNKDRFHLFPPDNPSASGIEVVINRLKALFIVRDFVGNPQYNERKDYIEGEKFSGMKVEVTFEDGEVLVGSTLGYDPKRQGFFLFPADPQSNNIRIFVVSSALKNVRYPSLG
jgi:hypothetical protein